MKQKFNEKSKMAYEAPAIDVISMEMEGVIAASGQTEELTPTPFKSSSTRSYSAAQSNDLEDMINDILTVGD